MIDSSPNLLMAYIGLVRALAWKIHQQLPRSVDLEDLVQYGCIGLAEAAQSFDSSRGLKFSTFAYHRIRGSILDGLSQMAWFRMDRFAANEYRHAEGHEEEGHPDDSQYKIENSREFLLGTAARLDRLADAAQVAARSEASDQPVMEREVAVRMRQLVDALPRSAADLLRATYYEGLSLKDAAARQGRSKSWASRLHARALKRLERVLRNEGWT